jgi:hypothetical protein
VAIHNSFSNISRFDAHYFAQSGDLDSQLLASILGSVLQAPQYTHASVAAAVSREKYHFHSSVGEHLRRIYQIEGERPLSELQPRSKQNAVWTEVELRRFNS